MKTKVEIEGYEIEIELENGVISVKAEKDDEVVEEFTIQLEEGQEGQDEEDLDSDKGDKIKGFGDFAQEEDFDDDEMTSQEEDLEDEMKGDEMEDKESPAALESFQSFINKRK
jgi:hypothetical protein